MRKALLKERLIHESIKGGEMHEEGILRAWTDA